MNYKTNAYLITCLTNLHVGSGGANYGVVDNLVQRDSITGVPTINSSSLKGALREFFKNNWGEGDAKLKYIFGVDELRNSSSAKKDPSIGHYKFFPADLLVLPVRSNKKPFYRATSKMLVDTINEKAINLTGNSLISGTYANVSKGSPKIKGVTGTRLEDWEAIVDNTLDVSEWMGENVAIFNDDTFKILASKLPVIARNHLENGVSKNLWYEEIVPRESRFVFFVSMDNKYNDDFDKVLDGAVVQIGANGSIGYGYCKIKKIYDHES